MAKSRKRQDGDQPAGAAAATADPGAPQPDSRLDPERISMRAYELYLARGGADGQAWDDWLAAERELSEAVRSPRDTDE